MERIIRPDRAIGAESGRCGAVDLDDLPAGRFAAGNSNAPAREVELGCEQAAEREVGGAIDRRSGHPRLEATLGIDAVDPVSTAARRQADGEPDGHAMTAALRTDDAKCDTQHEGDQQRREVEAAGRRDDPANGCPNGSVQEITVRENWFRPRGSTHETTTRATTSSQRSRSRSPTSPQIDAAPMVDCRRTRAARLPARGQGCRGVAGTVARVKQGPVRRGRTGSTRRARVCRKSRIRCLGRARPRGPVRRHRAGGR